MYDLFLLPKNDILPLPISQGMVVNRSKKTRSTMSARESILVVMFPLVPVVPSEFLK